MTINDIAIQNLRRRKGKTLLLFITFFLVVSTIASLNIFSLGLKEELQKSLNEYGANVVISPRSEHLSLSYSGLSVSDVNYEVKKLDAKVLDTVSQTVDSTVTIAPKVIGTITLKDKEHLIIGIDVEKELKMKPWMKIEGALPKEHQVVLGSYLASTLGLKKGDTMDLGQNKCKVVGILSETGGSEDYGVFTTINTARALTGIENEWTLIELNAPDSEKTVSLLSTKLFGANVNEVTQLAQGSRENVERFSNFARAISFSMAIIGVFVIMVTLASNINERAQELGILRSIGFRKKHIFDLLTNEVSIVSFSASLLGYLMGIIGPPILGPMIAQVTIPFGMHLGLGFSLILGSLLVGILAILYPTRRVLRI